MSTTSAKEVVLGVTGSIAAYKACEIASLLVKRGLNVLPVLTHSATKLVGPATFEALTGNRAVTAMFDETQNPDIEHIAVAMRVDLFLVAPATANVLAKAAHGITDDWLTTTLLATRAPILFAPAMNANMYEHPATQQNIATLTSRGCHFVGPNSGILACKTVGPGRMAEPAQVVEEVFRLVERRSDFLGKKILLTMGANHEPIDPVRFIGNRSSGKMGRALACEALRRGATVTVVKGPCEVAPPPGAEIIPVETALQMRDAVLAQAAKADVVIGAAAVADYRVAEPLQHKHKRNGGNLTLDLIENPDILAQVGATKRSGQIVVGFAAETGDLLENAQRKLENKNLNLIVANQVGVSDSGFGTDTVRAVLIGPEGSFGDEALMSKASLAETLFDRVLTLMSAT